MRLLMELPLFPPVDDDVPTSTPDVLPGQFASKADARPSFDHEFAALFDVHYPRLFRYLDRLCGDPDVAADVAQEALIRLYGRGALPTVPGAWLVSVAMNLLRNVMSTRNRRRRLLTVGRGERAHSDPPPASDANVLALEVRDRVRGALDGLSERDKQLILLRAEGYSYREIASALDMHEASIGTVLARAQREFRQRFGENI